MDAGTAAVLGAVVGAVGTGSAAFCTAWWAAQSAQRQIGAQETQALRQLRFDHVRDRRGPRSEAYSHLVVQAQSLLRELDATETGPMMMLTNADREILGEGVQQLYCSGARVAVEGPASVGPSADALVSEAATCVRLMMALERFAASDGADTPAAEWDALAAPAYDSKRQLIAYLDTFVDAARHALEEDRPNLE